MGKKEMEEEVTGTGRKGKPFRKGVMKKRRGKWGNTPMSFFFLGRSLMGLGTGRDSVSQLATECRSGPCTIKAKL